MTILGISCYYHDAAACIIKDGRIIAAAEEERFSRKKHDASFPKLAINFCLDAAHIKSSDLDYVVFYEKPFQKFHRIFISSLSTYPKSYGSFREAMRIWLTKKLWIKEEISSSLSIESSKILFSQHHLSHAASCFYPSPYQKAAILTVDGVGEWATASFGIGENSKIRLTRELHYPLSLGLLYSTFTAFLGFEVNEGEWKVMGLAPYGKPTYVDKIWKIVKSNPDGSISLDFSYFSYQYSDTTSYSSKFIHLFGNPIPPQQSHLVTQRSADLAASIQTVSEELLLGMVRNLKKITKEKNLCLSGGVTLNSVANYRILKEGGFDNIFIQPAAGDSGGAMGAALYVYHHILNNKKRSLLSDGYLGQQFDNCEIEKYLKSQNIKYKRLSYDQLIEYTADQIAQGRVIGWMQGRFEWGPRALGARSILADARNPKMKDIINSKVKFRESFRPFAPSVLSEHAYQIFELPPQPDKHLPLRFMQYVVPVKKAWREKIPAVNHTGNTARPQLVYKEDNPLYYSLIYKFYEKTGVPLILNTSFNLKGEPIVASPYDAFSTFRRSGIDILIIGNYICNK